MTDWKLPWSAQCLCGQIKLRITAPPVGTMACHCRGCQKLTSGPYSLSMILPQNGLEVVAGEPVLGGLHGEHQHFYCPHCKSWMFTWPNGVPFVNVRTTMLEDARWAAPMMEMYTSEKLPFAATGAEFSFEKFPDPSEFPALMQAFAERGPRP